MQAVSVQIDICSKIIAYRLPLMSTSQFNPDLIRRHNVNGPRYTSYPTADRFRDGPTSRIDLFEANAGGYCRNSTYHAPATNKWLFICSPPESLVSTRLFAFGERCRGLWSFAMRLLSLFVSLEFVCLMHISTALNHPLAV